MDLETKTKVMGDAVKRHSSTMEGYIFASSADLYRCQVGWSYRQLRNAAAELVRILDDYLIVEEADKAASGQ